VDMLIKIGAPPESLKEAIEKGGGKGAHGISFDAVAYRAAVQ